MNAELEADVVLSATDIARLAKVRRPAVSNWRRRFPDFPRPVGGTASHPLFSWREVEQWCSRHDKEFSPTPADRLWQRAEAVVGGAHMALFLAHVGTRLLGEPTAAPLPEPDPEWGPLLEQATRTGEAAVLYAGLYARFQETWARSEEEPSPETAALMVSLLGNLDGRTVLDPSCGSGRPASAAANSGAARLLLQERDPVRGAIALARLRLSGTDSHLVVGDALHEDGYAAHTDGIDAVVCSPPTRVQRWDQEAVAVDPRWSHGLPPRGEAALAWIQHCLARVRPGGNLVVRLPAAVAERRAGRRIRANLLRAGVLQGIAEVPDTLEPGGHLWLLYRCKPEERAGGGILAVSGASGAAEVTTAFHRFRDDREATRHGVEVPVADLLDGDVDLTPSAHQDSAHSKELTGELEEARRQIDALLAQAPAHMPSVALGAGTRPPTVTVSALAAEGRLEILRPPLSTPADTGPLPLLTAADVRNGAPPSSRGRQSRDAVIIRPGDVIVPPRGEGGRPRTAADAEIGAVLGPALTVLRPVDGAVDSDFLAGFLTVEAAQARRSGSGRSAVRSARIPKLSLAEQRRYGAAMRGIADSEEHLRRLGELGRDWADLARRALRSGMATPHDAADSS